MTAYTNLAPKLILTAINLITLSTGARAASPPTPAVPETPGLSSLNEVTHGTLIFQTIPPGRYAPAPIIATKVDVQVSRHDRPRRGPAEFQEPSTAWLEGVYAFPLPENAAVDQMRLRVGDQEIVARIANPK